MKSPWKFLVQLTARRRKEHAQDSSIGKVERRAVLPSRSLKASGTADHDEPSPVDRAALPANDPDAGREKSSSVDGEEVHVTQHDAVDHSETGMDALDAASKTSRQSQSTRRVRRAKRTSAHLVVQGAAAANQRNNALSSSSGHRFLDEVADLDEEVAQLKVALAQKLHLQNIQLKKMLERFDVS